MRNIFILSFFSVFNIYAFDIPSLYQCSGVQLIHEVENGDLRYKSFSVQSLFVKFDYNRINIYGIHSGKNICRSFDIARIFIDTVYIKTDIRELGNNDVKFYISNDTLIGNYDFLNSNTNQTSIKILVTKIGINRESGLKRLCK